MASKTSSVTSKNKPLPVINRTAIDMSGSLGSLYNAHRDQMVGKLDVVSEEWPTRLDARPQCTIKTVDINQNQNLLELIDFEEELRLSILFNLIPKLGLALLIGHLGPINEHTRLLCYTYWDGERRVCNIAQEAEKWIKSLTSQTEATHIITSVRRGISFVSVLQLPSGAETVTAIDAALKKLQELLNENYGNGELDSNDLNHLKEITATKVYSNIPALAKMTTIIDICHNIQSLKNNCTEHCQISYTLQPIESIYPRNNGPNNAFISIPSPTSNTIEKYCLDVSSKMKYITTTMESDLPKLLSEHFKEEVNNAYIHWSDLKKKYEIEIGRVAKLVIDIRSGHAQISQVEEVLNDEQQNTFKNSIEELCENLEKLEAKGHLIKALHKDGFKYWNVAGLNLGKLDNEQAIEEALVKDHENDRLLCSTDILKNTHLSKWNSLHLQLVEEHRNNSDLRLIYADFTYCSFQLSDIVRLPIRKTTKIEDTDKQSAFPQSVEPKPSATPLPSSSATDETINLLLVGESGVGKSTFINAFANYLNFDTLEKAESKKPIVLIPVSFLMTFGDNFTEHPIKLNVPDRSDNEDFNHPGQSVTQHCRSYVFNHQDGKKLRIIDTPGFGDTRGLEQDDINLQHILNYVHNLTHLNAICFLLKPDASRLNIFFRTCLTQLLDLLGPNAHKNVVFCFTNARSTFYTPGNTGPLLRAVLGSFSMGEILLKKENTFCFDSESFRYLVALQNSFQFESKDKNEYGTSWSRSMIESNRLINYICQDVTKYCMNDDWKSVKHAQLKIVHMIRPVLETMRNILRNTLLCDKKSAKRLIKLSPKIIDHPTTICLARHRDPIQVANFWILPDLQLKCLNKSLTSQCAPDQHVLIDYKLDYDPTNEASTDQKNELLGQLSLLHDTSAVFAHFLMCNGVSAKDDPFLTGLNRMIYEEKKICSQQNSNYLNRRLSEELEQVRYKFSRRLNEVKQDEKYIQLTTIYGWIQIIRNNPEVLTQLVAMKKGQESMMRQYEYEVPNDPSGMPTNLLVTSV